MLKIRSKILKAAIIFLCVLIFSACLELFFFNYHAIRYADTLELDSQTMLANSTGFKMEGDDLVPLADNAVISYKFKDHYYSKIVIEYTSTDDNILTMNLDSFDNTGNNTQVAVTDTYNHQLTRAVTNLNTYMHSISIVFPTQSISVSRIYLVNEIQFNAFRYIFMVVTGLLLAFFIFSRKILAERIELAFLITALAVGILMIILIPLRNPVTWDDDTHFRTVYEQSFVSEIKWTQAAYDYENRLVPAANTMEEKEDVIKLLNSENEFENPVVTKEKSLFIPYLFRCYIPQSAMLSFSRVLNLSFNASQSLSRIGGYLFYVAMIYIAIYMAKFGKRIIAAIALMPTPLFMAANFSYDQVVISLVILAFVVFGIEYFDHDHKLSLKNTAIFLFAILLASFTKAVYIPLILLLFLLPKEKFTSRRSMILFRVGICGIFLAVMATFVLPAGLNQASSGDMRGGSTSVTGQLHFILSDPIFYTRLLLKSIWDTLGSYFLGSSSYVNFAYLGVSSNNSSYISIFVILFALFTDAGKDDKYVFRKSSKLFIYAVIFSIMCLIWTALYLSFTPVGASQIAGVQSRYYIPLVVPLLFMLRTSKIETKINPLTLNRIILAGCAFITLISIYDFVLKPFNF